MVNNLSDLNLELREEVQHRSSANNIMKEEAFTEVFCDYLIEFGELDTFEPSAWRDKNLGAKISLMTKVVKVKGLEKCFQKKCPLGHFI